MRERRDTYTAVLFLVTLLAAVLFLLMGIIPRGSGFRDVKRPARSGPMALEARPLSSGRSSDTGRTGDGETRNGRQIPPDRTLVPSIRGHAAGQVSYEAAERALDSFIDAANPAINALLDRNHTFIELYGGVQRLLGRRVIEDTDPQYTVVRLDGDLLTFVSLEPESVDVAGRADEMIQFARRIETERQIPVLYVQAPSKLDVSPLPGGIADHTNADADRLLELLTEGDVDTLDLRPAFRAASRKDPEAAGELFFRTDHHWTPAGAFLGYQTLAQKLNRYPYFFRIDQETTEPDNFTVHAFEDIFLGSQGRRVGSLYAGLDRFDVWSPRFATDFSYFVADAGIRREGPFVTSLLFPERLADNGLYETNPYAIYSGGDYLLARAVNRRNPDGKRLLVLRDSFGCALTPFLALGCQEVMAVDPRSFNGNQDTMMEFLDWLSPDAVLILNTASSLRVDALFPYLPTARQNALAARQNERK